MLLYKQVKRDKTTIEEGVNKMKYDMRYDKQTGMFIYRGHSIFPLERTNGTPASVIRSYYADERQRIDRRIESEKKWNNVDSDNLHSADEDIDFFLNMVNN